MGTPRERTVQQNQRSPTWADGRYEWKRSAEAVGSRKMSPPMRMILGWVGKEGGIDEKREDLRVRRWRAEKESSVGDQQTNQRMLAWVSTEPYKNGKSQ